MAGTLDGTAMVELPPGVLPLVGDLDGLVAVEREGRGVAATSTLHTVSLAGGELRKLAAMPGGIDAGVIVGNTVVVSGTSGEQGVTLGVLAVERSSGATRVIMEPVRLTGELAVSGASHILALSPSGRALAVDRCLPESDGCVVTLVAVEGWSVGRSFDHPGFVRAVTDEVLIVGTDNWPGRISGLDLTDGRERWSMAGSTFSRGYVTAEGSYVVSRTTEPQRPVELLRIDVSTGQASVVASWAPSDNLGLVPELSTDRVAVLAPDPAGLLFPGADGTLALTTIELASGARREGAVVLVIDR